MELLANKLLAVPDGRSQRNFRAIADHIDRVVGEGGGGGGGGYVDRGSVASWDYQTSSFTRNGAWHDLDLSSIITDSDAKAAVLHIGIRASSIGLFAYFKKKGHTLAEMSKMIQVVNSYTFFQCNIGLDSNQTIEYYFNNSANWNAIFLNVVGWWL